MAKKDRSRGIEVKRSERKEDREKRRDREPAKEAREPEAREAEPQAYRERAETNTTCIESQGSQTVREAYPRCFLVRRTSEGEGS